MTFAKKKQFEMITQSGCKDMRIFSSFFPVGAGTEA